MAEFKTTEWEFSNEKEVEKKQVTDGEYCLSIKNASFDPEKKEYLIRFGIAGDDSFEPFPVRYWLDMEDKNTGNTVPNTAHRGTLVSLGKALAGKVVGIPAPCDIIGGVVIATVVTKDSQSGKKFYRIFKYEPAPAIAVIEHSQIEQYATDE